MKEIPARILSTLTKLKADAATKTAETRAMLASYGDSKKDLAEVFDGEDNASEVIALQAAAEAFAAGQAPEGNDEVEALKQQLDAAATKAADQQKTIDKLFGDLKDATTKAAANADADKKTIAKLQADLAAAKKKTTQQN